MPVTTKGTKAGQPGRPTKVEYDPTKLGEGFKEAAERGVGVQPGAGGDKYSGPHISNPFKDIPKYIGQGIKFIRDYDPYKKSKKPTRKPTSTPSE